jgi:outer membrane lipoprotein-sorting protein
MRATALASTVFLLGLLTQVSGAAELSAGDILKKVSETYQSIQSCRFAAVSEVGVTETNETNPTSGADEDSPNHGSYDTGEAVTSHIELAVVAPAKVRLSVKFVGSSGPGTFDDDFLVVSDGQTTWAYMPRVKEYTEESGRPPGTQGASPPKDVDTIRQYWSMLVGRFRRVDRFSSVAELEKMKQLKVGKQKMNCYLIRLQMESVTDEMWVDKDRFIVWRFKQTPRVKAPQGTTRQAGVTLNLTDADLNPQLDNGQFKFTPPEKAKKVASLNWPAKSK